MTDNLITIISIGISSFVTIVGFFLTYFLNKNNFKNELKKQQKDINLDKLSDLPYKIQDVYNNCVDESSSERQKLKNKKEFSELIALIFAYGSSDAIKLIANLQEMSYNKNIKEQKVDLIVYYTILLCQIKYDLTGIEINPQFWFRMKLTDYNSIKNDLDKSTNRIVDKLDLEDFLRVK